MLSVIGIALLSSYSYALYQVNFIKSNVVVLQTASNLTITTTIDDTNSNSFTLPASGNKTVVVHLDTNGITSAMAYKMYYEVTGSGKFTVTSTETFTDDKVEGIMQPYERTNNEKITGKNITLTFTNNSSTALTIKLGAIGGFEKTGASLTTEEELLVNTQLPVVHGMTGSDLSNKLGTDGLIAVNTNGELYDATDQTQTIREYRYSGGENDVKNYIWFNNENWRIVGIFDGHIKIVKDTPISSAPTSYTNKRGDTAFDLQYDTQTWAGVQVSQMYWNKDGGTRANLNDWSEAGLQYYLNEENSTLNNSYYDTMNGSYKGFIDNDTTYYLGKVVYNQVTPSMSYTQERDISSGNLWSGNPGTWTGKIGLLYPSDWGYATDPIVWNGTTTEMYNYDGVSNIKTRNWILKSNDTSGYYWLLSPSSSNSNYAMNWDYGGYVSSNFVIYNRSGVRPVLNLKSDTVIVSGEGTSGNPYRLIAE